MAAKIVIKIKDAFILQEVTFNTNSTKLVIGSNFPFQNSANPKNAENFKHLLSVYPILGNAGNISESLIVFTKLVELISGLATNGKIESLFSVIDASEAINLMEMAKDRSSFIGNNLLNYYFIEVNANELEQRLNEINNLRVREINPLLGVDYVYIRGELADIGQEVGSVNWTDVPIEQSEAILSPNIKFHLEGVLIDENNNSNKPISASPKIAEKRFNESKQAEPLIQNLNKTPNVATPQKAKLPVLTINQKITLLFNYCGLILGTGIKNLPSVKVVDMEQGWRFNSTTSYLGLGSKPILGGGINNANTSSSPTSHELHGERTINILFGNTANPGRINGLCKGANSQLSSSWYNLSTNGERRESALTSTLNKISIGDIVLLELQVDRKGYVKLPVEIESGMYDVILLGVKAWFIIIEAAGNGGYNLNNPLLYPALVNTINPTLNPPVNLNSNSTGAIMVGGIDPPLRVNTGNRIDYSCFAQNSTTSSGATFDSTSLASAILTGLVANFQDVAIDSTKGIGRRLTITEIRRLLKLIPYPVPSVSPYPSFQSFLISNNITLTSISPP